MIRKANEVAVLRTYADIRKWQSERKNAGLFDFRFLTVNVPAELCRQRKWPLLCDCGCPITLMFTVTFTGICLVREVTSYFRMAKIKPSIFVSPACLKYTRILAKST